MALCVCTKWVENYKQKKYVTIILCTHTQFYFCSLLHYFNSPQNFQSESDRSPLLSFFWLQTDLIHFSSPLIHSDSVMAQLRTEEHPGTASAPFFVFAPFCFHSGRDFCLILFLCFIQIIYCFFSWLIIQNVCFMLFKGNKHAFIIHYYISYL